MSRKELVQRIGKKYSYIAELERGGMKGSTKLHAIASALGVTAAYLETGKGERFSSTPADSEKFTPPSSHLLRPDPRIVRDANLFLTWKFAEANDTERLFDLGKHAELFSLAYQWVSDPADKVLLAELTRAINHAMEGGKHGSERDGGEVSGGRVAS